jgi:hypothetical protein
MSDSEADLFRRCTGRQELPTMQPREVWNVKGRRAGGSRVTLAFMAVAFATLRTYVLAPGERAFVLIFAADRDQAGLDFGYVLALLQAVPAFADLIVRQTADSIDLSNGVTIKIATASFRSPRGYKVVFAGFDEIAFFRTDDAANPDTEILRAVRPSLASVPESMLVGTSSPYAQRGELHKNFERHFARDGSEVLVWQADTRTMNPTIPQREVDRAMERIQRRPRRNG